MMSKLYILKNLDTNEKLYYLNKWMAEQNLNELNEQYEEENENSIHDTNWILVIDDLNIQGKCLNCDNIADQQDNICIECYHK